MKELISRMRIDDADSSFVHININSKSFTTTSSCASNEGLITITRVTKAYANEESFKIYRGTSTSGTRVFTQPTIQNNRSYTWYLCLRSGSHVLQLLDSYGDGWTSGSTVALSVGSSTLGPYYLGSGSSGSQGFNMVNGSGSG